MNISRYITPDDYAVWAGPNWPTYLAFVAGVQASKPAIRAEMDEFLQKYIQQGEQFPIDTATACQSKWTWSTIWLNKLSTASCHRVNSTTFDLENFDDFHNTPKKLADRKLMLNGQWPSGGCEYCKDIEDAGGWSDRQHNLGIRGLTPIELETDPTAIRVSPRIVEIFAQNTCNLACIYCTGDLSSKIEQENKKFGNFESGGVSIPVITIPTAATQEYFDRFISWIDKNVQNLVRLHLLGGETFIQHELMNSILTVLENRPSPNLELCVFSNLNVPDKYWDLYIGRIKDLHSRGHIRCFDLTASIDCWGPQQQYVRSGLNLQKFEQRFAWASEQGTWLRLNVNQTVTSMTIKTMPQLIEKIKYYSKNKHIGHYFQFCSPNESFQHPKIFAWDLWKDDAERILAAMPTDTVDQQEAIPRMQGLISLLKQHTTNNVNAIKNLHTYLDELDRRRSTNWRTLFPYLNI